MSKTLNESIQKHRVTELYEIPCSSEALMAAASQGHAICCVKKPRSVINPYSTYGRVNGRAFTNDDWPREEIYRHINGEVKVLSLRVPS